MCLQDRKTVDCASVKRGMELAAGMSETAWMAPLRGASTCLQGTQQQRPITAYTRTFDDSLAANARQQHADRQRQQTLLNVEAGTTWPPALYVATVVVPCPDCGG